MKKSAESVSGPSPREAWLNRNVVGMGIASLLSDASHEMATAVLPGFLAVLGLSPAALGLIEGVADSISSFVKLGSGWISDRLGHRKPMVVGGYFLTGASKALFAFAYGLPLLLVGRTLAWFGRGLRKPLRNAMLANSVPAEARGKAFDFTVPETPWAPSSGRFWVCGCWLTFILEPRTPPSPSALFFS
ncbi:MAG: MFS transporter [Terriglobia bacterium]